MSLSGNLPTFNTAYSLESTPDLIHAAREKWVELRDEIANTDDAMEMDTIFTAVFSRLTAYNEVVSGQKQRV